KSILVDVFSLPAEPDDHEAVNTKVKKDQGTKPGKKSPPTGDPPKAAPKQFRVEKIKGGFRIRPGDPTAAAPKRLDIKMAYSIRSGNPLKKLHKADFELDKAPFNIGSDNKGIMLLTRSGNEIRAEVTETDFLLSVTGFDENRDLFVKVTVPQEESD